MSVPVPAQFMSRVRLNEPMSRHTSWHAGGAAEVYFTPRDRADLAAFLRALPGDTPVHFVGLGSNLLVRDGGIEGVVVGTQDGLTELRRIDATTVYGEAGVPCARIARECLRWGLGPAEFFAGIPGTLGGALAMNAGAFGGETWERVAAVETLDRTGRERLRPRADYTVGYRHVQGPAGEWFTGARLVFEPRPAGDDAAMQALLARRRASQPIGEWSCGSVFRNPPGDHAARLIEASGLKGHRIGGAQVSEKHANFIVNHGAATAADLERLLLHVQAQVARQHGVQLVPEVRIVGAARGPESAQRPGPAQRPESTQGPQPAQGPEPQGGSDAPGV
ncbi:MAG TPA: UDP-N-acetylmuramate dehydrogenase [Steroidobacteraceae bacterium]|nr:UDP-N-acetylmuramate dehydrogenase [Steroidobacteraceae bacterium]